MKPDNVSKEFAGLVGDEWHEVKRKVLKDGYPAYECTCGRIFSGNKGKESLEIHCAMTNPTYIIELIKAKVQARGDWDGFVKWHDCQAQARTAHVEVGYTEFSYYIYAHADILTTPALLMQAYIAYRRQAEKCNGWCRTSKGPLEDMMSLHGAEMGLNVIDKTCREGR